MKNQDDGTLSLFDDFPPAFVPPAAPAKKTRAKRKTVEPKAEVAETDTDNVAPNSNAQAEAMQNAPASALRHLIMQ